MILPLNFLIQINMNSLLFGALSRCYLIGLESERLFSVLDLDF